MADTIADTERAFAALVEVERLGRHYSDVEGVPVLEIRTGRLQTIIAGALAAATQTARAAALEEAARLVDHHPFADDAVNDCFDAQGCCEMMASQIRSLIAPPGSTDAGGEG